MKTKLLTLAMAVACSFNLHAKGGRSGSGGDALVCYKTEAKKEIESVRFWDYVESEMEENDPITIGNHHPSVIQGLKEIERRFRYVNRNKRMTIRLEEMFSRQKSIFNNQMDIIEELGKFGTGKDSKLFGFVGKPTGPLGYKLAAIDDTDSFIEITDNKCHLAQIAYQDKTNQAYGKRIKFNRMLWEKLSVQDKVGLVNHELILMFINNLNPEIARNNTIAARDINMLISTDYYKNSEDEDYLRRLSYAGVLVLLSEEYDYDLSDVDHIYVLNTKYLELKKGLDWNPSLITTESAVLAYSYPVYYRNINPFNLGISNFKDGLNFRKTFFQYDTSKDFTLNLNTSCEKNISCLMFPLKSSNSLIMEKYDLNWEISKNLRVESDHLKLRWNHSGYIPVGSNKIRLIDKEKSLSFNLIDHTFADQEVSINSHVIGDLYGEDYILTFDTYLTDSHIMHKYMLDNGKIVKYLGEFKVNGRVMIEVNLNVTGYKKTKYSQLKVYTSDPTLGCDSYTCEVFYQLNKIENL